VAVLGQPGRLLCASSQAYRIQVSGPAPADGARSVQVGWQQQPQGFAAGQDLIDAGLVGVTPDALILAFRGTLSFQTDDVAALADWFNDFNLQLRPWEGPGRAHAGFVADLDALWTGAGMGAAAADLIAAEPGKPVWVTGHSKGGALAHLLAWRLRQAYPQTPIQVITFAAPRAGDAPCAAAIAAAAPGLLRYEYGVDIVPHAPPARDFIAVQGDGIWDLLDYVVTPYVSAGALAYIQSPGAAPQGDGPALLANRGQAIADLLRQGDLKRLVNDHFIDPGSGLAETICPGL
jgi:Lipase (class 3)